MRIIACLFLMGLIVSCGTDQVPPAIDCSVDGPAITAESTATGCADDTGTITASVTGGTSPLAFEIPGKGQNDTGEFTALSAGNYTVTVTDANDCTDSFQVTVASSDGPTMSVTITNDAGCGTSGGEVAVTASGGTGDYQYQIDNGDLQSEATFAGLAIGSHTIKVVDGVGCEVSETVSILSGISLASDIMPIINANCTSNSNCHVTGSGTRAVLQDNPSNVIANASGIKSRVVSGSMPKDGTLSQSDIDAISCWVDDGAPNN